MNKNINNMKLDIFIGEIDRIIKPKEKNITLTDIEFIEDIFYTIKNDKDLYALALKKYNIRIKSLEYIFGDIIRLTTLCEKVNDDSELKYSLEISSNIAMDELIMINYLYNLFVKSLTQKDVSIILYIKKETKDKTKYLQKK